jgi:hypothetical protein
MTIHITYLLTGTIGLIKRLLNWSRLMLWPRFVKVRKSEEGIRQKLWNTETHVVTLPVDQRMELILIPRIGPPACTTPSTIYTPSSPMACWIRPSHRQHSSNGRSIDEEQGYVTPPLWLNGLHRLNGILSGGTVYKNQKAQ